MKTKHLGTTGEHVVAQHLEADGFTILVRNFATKLGEIDLIGQKNDLITFVEVKTRMHEYFPISSVVSKPKQQKIIKTAKIFVAKHNIINKVLRFDVATVLFQENMKNYKIDYISDAFRE